MNKMRKVSPEFIKNARKVALEAVKSSAPLALKFRKNLDKLEKRRKDISDTSFTTEADIVVQRNILNIIANAFPTHQFIAEEELPRWVKELNKKNRDSEWVWIIDPIDGTRKFLDKNSNYYGIAVGLLKRGYPVLAVFYAPEYKIDDERGVLFEAYHYRAAKINGKRISVSPSLQFGRESAMISRTIYELVPNWKSLFASHFQKTRVRTGSGTLSLCRVGYSGVYGGPVLYIFGKTDIWNIVIGGYIVEKAGGICRDIYGRKIFPISPQTLAKNSVLNSVMAGHPKIVKQFASLARTSKLSHLQLKVLGYRAKGVEGIDPENPQLTMRELVSVSALNRYITEYRKDFNVPSVQRELSSSISKALESDDHKVRAIVIHVLERLGKNLGLFVEKLLKWEYWKNTERIFIGGGLSEGRAGNIIVNTARKYLSNSVDLRKIHYLPDEAGLIGATYLAPKRAGKKDRICVDLGGTRVRVGIVSPPKRGKKGNVRYVIVREHKNMKLSRDSLVDMVTDMVLKCMEKSETKGINLSKYICIGCPGMIDDRGYIIEGASNLPGNWTDPEFHLPTHIGNKLKKKFQGFKFKMRNDAVVQGLCEIPFSRDVEEWGILTIGTGLGNAKFLNMRTD